jgi:hypothetical protein
MLKTVKEASIESVTPANAGVQFVAFPGFRRSPE